MKNEKKVVEGSAARDMFNETLKVDSHIVK